MTAVAELSLPPQANIPNFGRRMRDDVLGTMTEVATTYGDIVGVKMGLQQNYLISNPDDIRSVLVTNSGKYTKGTGFHGLNLLLGEGLLTSEGDLHMRQRRLAQPAMHRERIAGYADIMVRYAARARDRWAEGDAVQMDQEMSRLTLTVVGKALLDVDFEDASAQKVRTGLVLGLELFNRQAPPRFQATAPKYREALQAIDSMIYDMIEERRAHPSDRGDLLSILMAARDEATGEPAMSELQLRDEAVTIIFAGHETTGTSLSWTWYELSQHPDIEARVHEEVDRVLGDRPGRFEDVERLRYTRMVFAEALRKYPPVWGFDRSPIVDVEIGGYRIPAGSMVWILPYLVHHDPRYYPDPERFDPERFAPETARERPKFAYLPFSGGPRLCYGEPFAWMEAVLIIATVAQRFHMELAPGHRVELLPVGTLRQSDGLRMIPRERFPGRRFEGATSA